MTIFTKAPYLKFYSKIATLGVNSALLTEP